MAIEAWEWFRKIRKNWINTTFFEILGIKGQNFGFLKILWYLTKCQIDWPIDQGTKAKVPQGHPPHITQIDQVSGSSLLYPSSYAKISNPLLPSSHVTGAKFGEIRLTDRKISIFFTKFEKFFNYLVIWLPNLPLNTFRVSLALYFTSYNHIYENI